MTVEKSIKLGLLIFFISIILGCATGPKIDTVKHHKGQVNLYSEKEKIYLYEEEYKSGVTYELGISLSGGGMRASSFSIGALAGLFDSGVLQQADFISTVSGGGYAGYWYINNLLYAESHTTPFDYQMLFDDCYPSFPNYSGTKNKFYDNCTDTKGRLSLKYRFQNQLAQQSDLLHYYQDGSKTGKLLQSGEEIAKVMYHIGTIFPHHLGNSIFDWGWNVSGFESRYQNGIERTFGLVPSNLKPPTVSTKEYLNDETSWGYKNAKAKAVSFASLQDFTVENWKQCSKQDSKLGRCLRVPLWIINSTAGVANRIYTWGDNLPPLSKSVFEITPFSFGSGEYGYVEQPFDYFDISKAVAVSGAAADPQYLSDSDSKLERYGVAIGLHLVNLGLGEKIRNYNPERSSKLVHSVLPWPLYYLHGFSRNKDSSHIYLSDGGHSENLGAYSLIVRGVKNILIIDTEHDENGNFGALRILQNKLKSEHGLSLEFENLPDSINVQEVSNNIFEGKVTGYREGYISGDGVVNVVYVKSAIRKGYMSPDCSNNDKLYPCSTYRFYSRNNLVKGTDGSCKLRKEAGLFPHHSTFKTGYEMSQDIFFSYRDFARHITNRIGFEDGKLTVDNNALASPASLPDCN